jgi:hypothetical protein
VVQLMRPLMSSGGVLEPPCPSRNTSAEKREAAGGGSGAERGTPVILKKVAALVRQ